MKNTTISRIRIAVSLSMRQCYLGFLMLFVLSSVTGYAQVGTVGIGSGTGTNVYMPIRAYYGYTYSQQIVTAAEYAGSGGVAGPITKIRFYLTNTSTPLANWNNWTVYIGHTSKTSFSSNTDWEPVANLTQVFSGTVTQVANSWMEITFSTPFAYNGTSNLIVAVDENAASYSDNEVNFGSYTSASNTGIYYYSDSTNPTPATPPTGTRTNVLARLQFEGALASCVAPTNINAAATASTAATVNWTASASAPANGYEYYYSTTNTAPTAATTPSGSVGAGVNTASISGLTANTPYYVWVRSACSVSTTSSWSAAVAFTTPCDAINLPYVQDFESVTTPAIPECSSIQNAGAGNNWNTINNPGAGFTSKTLRYQYTGSAANAWWFTRGLNLTAGVSYTITYRYGNSYNFYTEKLKVSYGTANNAAAMTTVIADHPTVNQGAPQTNIVTFTPTTTGVHYIGFNAYSAAWMDNLYVDDISVEVTPTCVKPTQLMGVATGFTTGTVSYTASTTPPANGYEYYYSTTNTAPTASTTASGSVAAGVTSVNLTGLTAESTYYVWVRSVCSASDSSTWAGPATFFTGYCTPVPSSQDGQGITNVVLGTIANPTGSETGYYGNYSSLSTNAALGSTVNFAITYATGYTYGTKIWVDWNNDADFDDAGELVYTGLSTNANPTTLTGSFAVPADAALVGAHRVRIGGTDNDTGGTPCYTGSYGTYEDYTLNAFMPPAPVVTGFTPASYCAATGDITITGTDLGNATVTVGGTAVTLNTNTDTQITATIPAGVSGVVAVTTVAGTSTTAASFSVVEPTALVLSGTEAAICAGSSTAAVTITAGGAAYDTYTWSPSAGVTGDAATGWIFNPAETTTYTLTASQSAGPCVVNVEYEVTVNPLPQPVTIAPASADVCLNSVVTLTATGGASALPSAYCVPTITSSGATGDFINNFTFANITNNASGDAATDFTFYPALTANVQGGQSYSISVQSGASWGQNFRVWIDFNHDGVYSADESVFNTTTSSTAAQTGTITIPATAFNGTTRMRVGARYGSTLLTATEACGHSGFGEYEDYNVNITGATNPVDYVWAPVAGLYTDAAATVPYTGTPAQVVYAKITSETTTSYTATATSDANCSATGTTTLTTLITPEPTGASAITLCSNSTVADLTATGTAIQWYTAATGGSALASGTALSQTTYYASQTLNGCESITRMPVTVTFSVVAAPTVDNDVQIFCNAGTVGELMANGTGILWYTSATGGQSLDPATPLQEGVDVYYASQTVDGCESSERVAVAAMVNIYEAPIAAQTTQTFCAGSGVTVADLMVYGQDITWYADATTDTPLADDTVLVSGVTYYASQTIFGCESSQRVAVTAVFNVTPAPQADAEQNFCNSGTVANLIAQGNDVQWYAAAEGGEPLTADTVLEDGVAYYASQTMNGCEGTERTMVTAYVSVTAAPTGTATQEITETVQGTATIEQIEVEGDNIVWYASEEDAMNGNNPLEQGTLLQSGATYYATQTVNGCTSAPFAVTVTVSLGNELFDASQFTYYPNPVKDVLTIKYSSDIASVTVYNMLGQQVLVKQVNATTGTLDMSVLQDGTYIVNITSGNTVKTIKVIKKQ